MPHAVHCGYLRFLTALTRFEGKAIAGYLCKPFEIQTLKAAVREALDPSHGAPAKDQDLCMLAG